MKYHITKVTISISKFFSSLKDFFDSVAFHTNRSIHILRTHEKTKVAGYHVKKAGKNLISKTKENAWNWNHRLLSSESFRIFDEDV
jgi:hypothetical protein